jgi:hypothetical protein
MREMSGLRIGKHDTMEDFMAFCLNLAIEIMKVMKMRCARYTALKLKE